MAATREVAVGGLIELREPIEGAPAGARGGSGEPVRLSDFKGQTVVLYFYPRADTRINSVGPR